MKEITRIYFYIQPIYSDGAVPHRSLCNSPATNEEEKISISLKTRVWSIQARRALVDIPVISSGVQANFKQDPSVSLNAVLGQVQSLSTEEAQPATDAASDIHRNYRHEKSQSVSDRHILNVEQGGIQDMDWHHRQHQ